MAFILFVLWTLFIISMVLLMGVILLQEGKGGGLAEAFGGVGAETFGVKATGINRFTGIVGALFLGLAILINVLAGLRGDETLVEVDPAEAVPSSTINPADLLPPPEDS